MAGYENSSIELDSPRNVYYAGQLIQGSIIIKLDQPQTLSVLYMNFLGEATVNWDEIEIEEYNGVKRHKTVKYAGKEEYFNVTQVLVGGNAPLNLPPGSHTYKFSYQIPPGVPSSFTGDRGSVTYSIKANLELRGQTIHKDELKKVFEVVAPFDLNFGNPALKEPIEFEFEETDGCGCFGGSKPLKVYVKLPVSGYCPGQLIPVAVEAHNDSSVEIRKMVFQILMRQKFLTQRPVSEFIPPKQVLETVTTGPVMSRTKRSFKVDVRVPEIIAPNLESCGIIFVAYFFKVLIKLSGCNDDLEDEAEICLGLVPLKETLDGEYIHPLSHSLPVGPLPSILPPNQEENRQHAAHQQSAYPNGPHFQNTQGLFQYPANAPQPFPNAGYPNDPNILISQNISSLPQQPYPSSNPVQSYDIGFKISPLPDPQPFNVQNTSHNSDLKVHLPPPSVNVFTPSAPPPSS